MVEMSIGRYPVPPPEPRDLDSIFGENATEEHIDAAQTGKPLKGRDFYTDIFIKFIEIKYKNH